MQSNIFHRHFPLNMMSYLEWTHMIHLLECLQNKAETGTNTHFDRGCDFLRDDSTIQQFN